MRQFSPDANGFSLIEAIVALAIVALLASLASESFRYAAVSRATIASMAAQFEADEALRRVLERSVSSAINFDSDQDAGRPAFQGTQAEMIFSAPLPASEYRGAPGEYHLALTKGREWVLGWHLEVNSVSGERYSGVTALAKDVTEVSIEYFGPVSPDHSAWVSTWARKSLPQLVRFRWREGHNRQQLVVRLSAARADCFPSDFAFARDCLE